MKRLVEGSSDGIRINYKGKYYSAQEEKGQILIECGTNEDEDEKFGTEIVEVVIVAVTTLVATIIILFSKINYLGAFFLFLCLYSLTFTLLFIVKVCIAKKRLSKSKLLACLVLLGLLSSKKIIAPRKADDLRKLVSSNMLEAFCRQITLEYTISIFLVILVSFLGTTIIYGIIYRVILYTALMTAIYIFIVKVGLQEKIIFKVLFLKDGNYEVSQMDLFIVWALFLEFLKENIKPELKWVCDVGKYDWMPMVIVIDKR